MEKNAAGILGLLPFKLYINYFHIKKKIQDSQKTTNNIKAKSEVSLKKYR